MTPLPYYASISGSFGRRRHQVRCGSPVLESVSILALDGLLQVAQARAAETFDGDEYHSHHNIYRQKGYRRRVVGRGGGRARN